MKHRFFSFLTAGCAAITLVTTGFSGMNTKAAEEDSSVLKIMAIGDSITDGYINGDNGYRKYLCYYLQQAGFTNFDMVGSQDDWTDAVTYTINADINGITAGTVFEYDPANEGYSGYTIQSYGGRMGIYETLFQNGDTIATYDPDIVLLQIGTNDVLDANNAGITDRLEQLIDRIEASLDTDAMLFVASIPYIDVDLVPSWVTNYEWTYGIPSYSEDPETYMKVVTECVDAYNTSIQTLVEEKQAEGYHIYFSDINSVVDMKTGLEDGVHPNEFGYARMGEYWANLILSYSDDKPISTAPTAPTIETTTKASTEVTNTSTSNIVDLWSGDVNLDETVNLADVVLLQKYLIRENALTKNAYLQADLTQDGKVDGVDLTALRQIILQRG